MRDDLLARLLQAIENDEAVALLTVIKATGSYEPALGQRALVWLTGDPYGTLDVGPLAPQIFAQARHLLHNRRLELLKFQQQDGEIELFVEVQRRRPTLLIVGAGHVALPLAKLGNLLNFEVVVLDDRPKFANKQRFPTADQVLAQPFQETLRAWPIDKDTYIVLVTRGHSHDVEALLEVIDSAARYIGMIGSKRRIRAVFELLQNEKGVDPSKFERVYAPIGLDIGAETPAEIAVCIAAEIVNLYRGGRATSLSEALRQDYRLPLHPARRS